MRKALVALSGAQAAMALLERLTFKGTGTMSSP